MLKRTIKYKNFEGNDEEDIFYFNISTSELLEFEYDVEGGMTNLLHKIVETKDEAGIIKEMKKVILLAYGQKSDDGKRFIKSSQLREEFTQTAAFDALFMELATSDDAAIIFIRGVMPADLSAKVTEENIKEKMAEKLGTTNPIETVTVSEVNLPSTSELAAQRASDPIPTTDAG